MRKNEILSTPTRPLKIDGSKSVSALLEKMQGISFQGRNLATAYQVWKKMLGDRVMIMMGMSGAMVPAGMRRRVVYMIKNRVIDCLVTTGANLFHDIHETLGRLHFQCSPNIDDVHLQKHLIDRMYDTLADEEEFREADAMIGRFAATLDQSRPYTTREPHRLIAASCGVAIPSDRNTFGYLSEHHSFGETEEVAGEYAEELAAEMLATTLGVEFDPDRSWNEKKEIYMISNKIVRTMHVTQSAIGDKRGLWTTVLSAAILLGIGD